MRPQFDVDEDLGTPEKRYRRVHATTLVTGGDGREISLANLPVGTAVGFKIARGVHTTVAASDTVVTGLATVVAVVVSMGSDPVDDPFMCSATIGDQAGSPAAGSVLIKTWKNTAGTDPTPAAAGTFTKLVNWIAIGT